MDGIELISAELDRCFEVTQHQDQAFFTQAITVSSATGHEARSELAGIRKSRGTLLPAT